MDAKDVKTKEDFECLMRERAEEFVKNHPDIRYDKIPGIGGQIYTNEGGEPIDEDGKTRLCEMNRLALSLEDAWVECGPLEWDWQSGERIRSVMLYYPSMEIHSKERDDVNFILWMNIFKKRPPTAPWNFGDSAPRGSFCTVQGGCL